MEEKARQLMEANLKEQNNNHHKDNSKKGKFDLLDLEVYLVLSTLTVDLGETNHVFVFYYKYLILLDVKSQWEWALVW